MSEQFISDLAGRVGRIEAAITTITADVGALRADMKHVATKTWVLGGVAAVLVAILGAAWWMVQQYLGPILQALPQH